MSHRRMDYYKECCARDLPCAHAKRHVIPCVSHTYYFISINNYEIVFILSV